MNGCVCTKGKSSVRTSTPRPRETGDPVRGSTTSATTKGSGWYQPHRRQLEAPPKISDREYRSFTGMPQNAEMRSMAALFTYALEVPIDLTWRVSFGSILRLA